MTVCSTGLLPSFYAGPNGCTVSVSGVFDAVLILSGSDADSRVSTAKAAGAASEAHAPDLCFSPFCQMFLP